jgi:hypothetical protein
VGLFLTVTLIGILWFHKKNQFALWRAGGVAPGRHRANV